MIQHAISKPSLVNLISKTPNWYSIYQFTHWFIFQNGDYYVIVDVPVDSTSSTSLKKQRHVDLIKTHPVLDRQNLSVKRATTQLI